MTIYYQAFLTLILCFTILIPQNVIFFLPFFLNIFKIESTTTQSLSQKHQSVVHYWSFIIFDKYLSYTFQKAVLSKPFLSSPTSTLQGNFLFNLKILIDPKLRTSFSNTLLWHYRLNNNPVTHVSRTAPCKIKRLSLKKYKEKRGNTYFIFFNILHPFFLIKKIRDQALLVRILQPYGFI